MTKLRIRLKGLVDSISDDDWIRDLLDKAKDKGFVATQLDSALVLGYSGREYSGPVILLEHSDGRSAVISHRDNGYFLDVGEIE